MLGYQQTKEVLMPWTSLDRVMEPTLDLGNAYSTDSPFSFGVVSLGNTPNAFL